MFFKAIEAWGKAGGAIHPFLFYWAPLQNKSKITTESTEALRVHREEIFFALWSIQLILSSILFLCIFSLAIYSHFSVPLFSLCELCGYLLILQTQKDYLLYRTLKEHVPP